VLFLRVVQTNPTESEKASQSASNAAVYIVFQCPHCRTTLRLDRAAAGATLNCESCQKLIRVPRSRAARKTSSEANPTNHEAIEELERRLKENESQRTEITGYINQGNIQLHRWQLQLQTLNERKQQLEAEIASRKT
jgi:DNA-directed RNA polymerase subunit M/transcription elongation factor TFIIS